MSGPDPMCAEVVLRCRDLAANQAFFAELGFRLDAVVPADDPRELQMSGHGLRLCLQRGPDGGGQLRLRGAAGEPRRAPNGALVEHCGATRPQAFPAAELVVGRAADGAWVEGRAGMRYRDLLPGRCGGRVIASAITILEGGEVPDYVHCHEVEAQLIFCRRGWVRVVYEDQGPPLELHAGDCLVQPPGIRHRVLACSTGLEVLEVTAPAEHVTRVEHELTLPTAALRPERRFGGQRFALHRAAGAVWHGDAAGVGGWQECETGIGAATDGAMQVVHWRASARANRDCADSPRLRLWFVLEGGVLCAAGGGTHALAAGEAVAVPAGQRVAFTAEQAGAELLEVALRESPVRGEHARRKS